ncbi:MAG: GDSL-like Lipase/Acylhydrolase family, partial [Reyranella sp.]|nr:GDSL-like Lipase/Acylhydrolase family [Reyranella sp.]
VETGENADLVSCRLMDRFAALIRHEKVEALVVAFPRYEDWAWPRNGKTQHRRVATVLDCANKAGLQTLNTYEAFENAGVAQDPEDFFVDWHFNDRANALAARLIASTLGAGRR